LGVGELRRTNHWQRGRNYVLSGDEIVEAPGSKGRSYDPTVEDELPERLIEVATGLTPPEQFAKEYGRLGRIDETVWKGGENVEEQDLVPDAYLRDVVLTKKEQKYAQFSPWEGSESVRWILWHAQTVKAARDLIGHLKAKNTEELRAALKKLRNTHFAFFTRLSSYGEFDWVREYAERDLHAAAHAAIIALINPNLRGVQYELQMDELGNLRYALTYQTLAQVIYWKLALRIENKTLLWSNCKKCGQPFSHTDSRQQYCPRLPGQKRSVCGSRAIKEAFLDRWPDGKSKSRRDHGGGKRKLKGLRANRRQRGL
jgi:hypothetical protein